MQPQYSALIWILKKIHNVSSETHTEQAVLKIPSLGELVEIK